MGRNTLGGQRWHFLSGRFYVLPKLVTNARGSQRVAVTIHEDPILIACRLLLQKRLQQVNSLRPERAEAFLAPLTEQTDLRWRFQTDFLRTQIERLLNACTGVVQQRQQYMI